MRSSSRTWTDNPPSGVSVTRRVVTMLVSGSSRGTEVTCVTGMSAEAIAAARKASRSSGIAAPAGSANKRVPYFEEKANGSPGTTA